MLLGENQLSLQCTPPPKKKMYRFGFSLLKFMSNPKPSQSVFI